MKKQGLIYIFCLFLFSFAEFALYRNWGFDDSFIVFRIARNLLDGFGWHYNPGEMLNASTSVLNTVLTAIVGGAIGDIPLAGNLLGALFIFGASILLFQMMKSEFSAPIAMLGGIGLIFTLSRSQTWGLETHLFIFLFFLFIYLETLKKNSWPILGLLVLTRPDALLIVGFKCIVTLWNEKKIPWKGLLTVLMIILPWVIFSLITFHQVFPNTLANKMWQARSGYWTGGRLAYLKDLFDHFQSRYLIHQVVWILGLIGWIPLIRKRHPLLYLIAFAVIQQSSYVILRVPGYHWYFVSLNIALYVGCAYLLSDLTRIFLKSTFFEKSKARFAIIGCVLICGFYALLYHWQHPKLNPAHEANQAVAKKIQGLSLGNEPVALLEVGFFGYYMPGKIIDLTALTTANSEYITNKHLDTFFEDPPLWVVLYNPLLHFEKPLAHDYRFQLIYQSQGLIPCHNLLYPNLALECFVLKKDFSKGQPLKLAAQTLANHLIPPFQLDSESKYPIIKSENLDRNKTFVLETINHGRHPYPIAIISTSWLSFGGWAYDPEQLETPEEILLSLKNLEGEFYVIPMKRYPRPDIADKWKNPALLLSGFEVEGNISLLPSGTYTIQILQRRQDSYITFEAPVKIIIPNRG